MLGIEGRRYGGAPLGFFIFTGSYLETQKRTEDDKEEVAMAAKMMSTVDTVATAILQL